MKTITVGDLHGRSDWNRINPDQYDKIIFLGDYVDSFVIEDNPMLSNLLNLIQFKKDYPDKVVLLIGNHELSYLSGSHRCSGFRPTIANAVYIQLTENEKLFQPAFQLGKYLWTHAGLHRGYYNQQIKPNIEWFDNNLEDTITRLYHKKFEPLFEVGYRRGGSSRDIGGPFWVDRELSQIKPLQNYHQIVGHTPVKYVMTFYVGNNTSITFCDCIERGNGKFHEVEISDKNLVV